MKFILNISVLAMLASFATAASAEKLRGTVRIDGSSTVFPITEAVAEEFQKVQPRVRVTVGVSGTGGGFKKFAKGETDISGASRPIKKKEITKAKEGKIEFIELPVAYDGISVVVSKKNPLSEITVDELHQLWKPESKVKKWNQINKSWKNVELNLYGPGPDSGTFDYFTKAINGKEKASRSDYVASEDDNVIVRGVSEDPNAIGYFGYAYYNENKNKLKALAIKKDRTAIAPTVKTIEDGSYPLARPVFIYVALDSAKKPEVEAFVNFYLDNVKTLAKEVGYIPLPDAMYKKIKQRFAQRLTGTVHGQGKSKS